jgi:hypothetical protein
MKEKINQTPISIPRLLIKIIVILIIINFSWVLLSKLPLGKVSLYNVIFDGRLRLPFGENPAKSYNLSLFDMDAMFESHKISDKTVAANNSINIILLGDSSIWGFLQRPEETLTGLLSKRFSKNNENVTFYNFGYPSISVLKDLLLIEKIIEHQPDLIIWFSTLEALPISEQLNNPLIENNPVIVNKILDKYQIENINQLPIKPLQKTLLNQIRNISNLFDLQLYGIHWTATGIDQEYPANYRTAKRDFEDPISLFHGISTNEEDFQNYLGLEIFKTGIEKNPDIDFILINEPILVSDGINSSVQYNYYYPKWAYEQYRIDMENFTQENKITYYDFWNLIPQDQFTNSAIHLSLQGEILFANEIAKIVDEYLESKGVNE